MKKKPTRKINIQKTTLVNLAQDQLRHIVGATGEDCLSMRPNTCGSSIWIRCMPF
jgi:hypothetical protein